MQEGAANSWFLATFDEVLSSFAEFEAKFRERWDCDNSTHAVTSRLTMARQQEGQTGSAFVDEIKSINNDMYPKFPDKDLLDFLKRGLNESYAKQVLNCESMDSATREIREYDRFRAERRAENRPSVTFADAVPQLSGQTLLVFPKGQLSRKDDLPATSTPRPISVERRYQVRQQNCFACGETGHYASAFPNAQSVP